LASLARLVRLALPIIAGLVRCVDQVPADVPVGLHLCYGEYGPSRWAYRSGCEIITAD
jgi:hypothetical protein